MSYIIKPKRKHTHKLLKTCYNIISTTDVGCTQLTHYARCAVNNKIRKRVVLCCVCVYVMRTVFNSFYEFNSNPWFTSCVLYFGWMKFFFSMFRIYFTKKKGIHLQYILDIIPFDSAFHIFVCRDVGTHGFVWYIWCIYNILCHHILFLVMQQKRDVAWLGFGICTLWQVTQEVEKWQLQ